MLSHIRVNDYMHGVAIAEAAGTVFNPHDNCISRVTSKGNLMGGVVYTGYTGEWGSIGMHVTGFMPMWLNRDLLWTAFNYPFDQLRVRKIFIQVPESNARSLAFTSHIGFTVEHVIKDVYPDGDMILMAMYREDCRFLAITPRTAGNRNG